MTELLAKASEFILANQDFYIKVFSLLVAAIVAVTNVIKAAIFS